MKNLIPHITEKSYVSLQKGEKMTPSYTFRLPSGLNKEQIKRIIEKEHNVHVIKVRTIHLPGKVRQFRGMKGRTSPLYKAIVRLKTGEKIAAFEIDQKTDPKE